MMVSLMFVIVCIASLTEGHNHKRHQHNHGHHKSKFYSNEKETFFPKSFWKDVTNQNESISGAIPRTSKDFEKSHSLDQKGFHRTFQTHSLESKNKFQKVPNGFVKSKTTVQQITHQDSYIDEGIYSETQPPWDPDEHEKTFKHEEDRSFAEPIRMQLPEPHGLTPSNERLSASRWAHRFHDKEAERALNYTRTNIKASIGGSAFLSCRVGHLGDRQISWIRSRDWHVLTSGKTLYTHHDKRFIVLHEPGSQDWILQIKNVNMKDAGNYECQVSTGTGIISMFVNLQIVIPKAYIPGNGQYVVNRGSLISITCYIRNSPSPPQYIFWHREGKLLNFIRTDPQVTLTTNLDFRDDMTNLISSSRHQNTSSKEYFSRLDVNEADEQHSGNYTCSSPNATPASTYIFVTEGDKTAAVQRIDTSGSGFINTNKFTLFWLLVLVL